MVSTVFCGAVISPQKRDPKKPISYNAWPRALLEVSEKGKIERIIPHVNNADVTAVLKREGLEGCNKIDLGPGQFIMPGLIDTHTHAPQFPNLGIGGEYELLEWLNVVVYPREASFADNNYARKVYPSVVRRVINLGTTTCCYYGSIHLEATKILVDIVQESGQRAIIGKCNMDREVPENNLEDTQQSIADTKELIKYIKCLKQTSDPVLIQPAVTPRFAISCTCDLLKGLGEIASHDSSLHIQTHISENLDDIARMGQLFPGNKSYADVYDSFGLLRPKTILAHAVYLGDDEVELIAKKGAGISHCPTSNFNLTSGVAAPVGKYLDAGIKVGLGTDVGGGFEPSILNVIQHASIAAKVLSLQQSHTEVKKPGYTGRKLSVATLLYLATLGGAQVCGLDEHIGSFEVGKTFDALLVTVVPEVENPGLWPPCGDEEAQEEKNLRAWLERFLFCGDDRNILGVYVQGKLIGGKMFAN